MNNAICTLCKIEKEIYQFQERPSAGTERTSISSWCKSCRKLFKDRKKYPIPCLSCYIHKKTEENGICKKCNLNIGLKTCKICLIQLTVDNFRFKRAICRVCEGILQRWRRLAT